MLYEESGPTATMQELLCTDGGDSQTTVLQQKPPTHRSLSFIDRDEQNYHSHDMPWVCARIAEGPDEIQQSGVYMEYLNEGAANVVFSIREWSAKETSRKPLVFEEVQSHHVHPRSQFLGRVLRLSKSRPMAASCTEIVDGFENEVKPLFRPQAFHPAVRTKEADTSGFELHLMDHEPITLTKDVVEELYCEIDERSYRCDNEHIQIVDQIGILLPDMSSIPGKSITIEIKPKWLAQSPNAPRDAFRCRTCALEASRSSKEKKAAFICPLQLLAGNSKLIRPYVRFKILEVVNTLGEPQPTAEETDMIVNRVTEYLGTTGKGHALLKHLWYLQSKLDVKGVRAREEASKDQKCDSSLRLAMTLRDCSLFIQVPYSGDRGNSEDSGKHREIESKLGDLDLKSALKIKEWNKKEKALLNGGWYIGMDLEDRAKRQEKCLVAAGWRKYVPYHW